MTSVRGSPFVSNGQKVKKVVKTNAKKRFLTEMRV
jgi:hypothetical protein